MTKRKQKNESAWGKRILWGAGILLVGSVFWSIIYETLLPLWRAGQTGELVANLIGIPIILLGTAVIVYGGFRSVKGVLSMMNDPQVVANVVIIKEGKSDNLRTARWQNIRLWWQSLWPGLLIMLGGFGLIAIGGFLIN